MNAARTGLHGLQAAFRDYLLNRGDTVAAHVRSAGRIAIDRRLGIYHNAYRVRLADTLRDTFEKTWAYVGDATFETLARAYVESHPPVTRSLRDYGDGFADWLAEHFPDDADVAELARMDWMVRQAFDGPDAEPMALEALAGVGADAWESVGFRCVPTLAVMRLRFNTPAIWHALDRGETPPESQRLPAPASLCVWRRGWQPHFRSLDETERGALDRVRAGAPFAAVCEWLGDTREDAPALVAHYLRAWLTEGWIAGFESADRSTSTSRPRRD